MWKVEPLPATTLRWWYSQRSKIDMSPTYQRRGRLWSKRDKAFLIDSILNGYDIPKVYIADFAYGYSPLNTKKLSFAIIDGKQRFEAIFDFFDGKLTLDDHFVLDEQPQVKLAGVGYADLKRNHPEVADIFDQFNLSVVRVIADDEAKINELFVRLNRSKPLTGAEIRNAMGGPVPDLIRLIVGHQTFVACICFPTTRGQDQNAAAKLLLFEFDEEPTETKRRNIDDFVERAKLKPDDLELASRRVIDTLDRMGEMFLPRDTLLKSSGVLPVLYWFVRNLAPEQDRYVREFLLWFQHMRQVRKTGGVLGSDRLNADITAFDILNRSTDDKQSHIRRHEILAYWFQYTAGRSENKT